MTGAEASSLIMDLTRQLSQRNRPVDFELTSGLTDSDYEMLTGVNQEIFNELVEYLKRNDMRNSCNRSLRNALGVFLMKIRLNLSQRVLAFLFGIADRTIISQTITAVLNALSGEFSSKFSGHNHLSRDQLMQHMRPLHHSVLGKNPEDMILIADGTYLYTQKPADHYLRRRNYSSHKHRNLFKTMMIVAPDGYIVNASGLYFSDGKNNDAKILEHMWRKVDNIITIFQQRDCLILDRGFRDVIEIIESSGVETVSPPFLKKDQKQFTAAEANASRRVTKLRWVVGSINSRLKLRFRFFQETIPVSYFKKLDKFLQVAVSIINAFSPPLFTETEFHEKIAEIINNHTSTTNKLQKKVERLGLHRKSQVSWMDADEDSSLDFPDLTMEDLKLLTLGEFQLEQGKMYNKGHIQEAMGYNFQVHKDLQGLIRVRFDSRFMNSKHHQVWIEFKENQNGRNAIIGHFCQCKSGARTLGCCSHVAAVSYFMLIHTLYFIHY